MQRQMPPTGVDGTGISMATRPACYSLVKEGKGFFAAANTGLSYEHVSVPGEGGARQLAPDELRVELGE